MKKRLGQLRSILLCGLGGFGAGLSLCVLMGFPPVKALTLAAAGVLGGTFGAMTMERSDLAAGCLFGASILSGLLMGAFCFRATTSTMVTMIVSGLSAGALMVGGYGFYGPVGVWNILLLALGLWASGARSGISQPWRWGALSGMVLALILTMDGFREKSMREAQLRDRHSPGLGNPSHILGHSYLLLGIFLIAALSLGVATMGLGGTLVQGTKHTASGGAGIVSKILGWIIWAITAFLKWFSSLFHAPSDKDSFEIDSVEKPQYSGGDGSWLSTLLMILIIVTVVFFLTALVGAALVRARKKTKQTEEIPDYIDEIEMLERPKWDVFRKRVQRKQQLRDFEDPAMKIRFVFQQLLRSKQKKDVLAFTRTPNELEDISVPDEAIVIRAYNRVKYARRSVSAAELETAERYWKNLR